MLGVSSTILYSVSNVITVFRLQKHVAAKIFILSTHHKHSIILSSVLRKVMVTRNVVGMAKTITERGTVSSTAR